MSRNAQFDHTHADEISAATAEIVAFCTARVDDLAVAERLAISAVELAAQTLTSSASLRDSARALAAEACAQHLRRQFSLDDERAALDAADARIDEMVCGALRSAVGDVTVDAPRSGRGRLAAVALAGVALLVAPALIRGTGVSQVRVLSSALYNPSVAHADHGVAAGGAGGVGSLDGRSPGSVGGSLGGVDAGGGSGGLGAPSAGPLGPGRHEPGPGPINSSLDLDPDALLAQVMNAATIDPS